MKFDVDIFVVCDVDFYEMLWWVEGVEFVYRIECLWGIKDGLKLIWLGIDEEIVWLNVWVMWMNEIWVLWWFGFVDSELYE